MSKELNELLKQAYIRYKDDSYPPVPLRAIREYLKLEGVDIGKDSTDVKNLTGGEKGNGQKSKEKQCRVKR